MKLEDIAKEALEDIKGLIDITQDDVALVFDECLKKAELALRQGKEVDLSSLGTFRVDGDKLVHVVPAQLLQPWPEPCVFEPSQVNMLNTGIQMANDLRDVYEVAPEATRRDRARRVIEAWERSSRSPR